MTQDVPNNQQDNRHRAETSNRESADLLGLRNRITPQQIQAWLRPGLDLDASRRLCRSIATSNYENFLVATVFLPRRLRQPFYDVYAFCRTADDLADRSGEPTSALARLDDYSAQLDIVERGKTPSGIFVALADTMRQFHLSRQPFDDLLSAFRQDQTKHRYQTVDELLDYCRRSANPVGRIVLQLADSLDAETALLSDQICTGLQLVNFWQDLARDFQDGRIYLPADEMHRYGVSEAMLAVGETPTPLRELIRAETDRAEQYFRGGLPLADRVPNWLRKDILLFAHGGLQTIEAIRRIDFDVLRVRPKVTKSQQLRLLLRAGLRLL